MCPPEPAEVFIDGKKYAEGSGVFKLPTGDHIVEVKKEGFSPQKLKVFIGPDALITKTVTFIPPPPPAIETRTDSLTGMEFVKIPAGCFQMGCGPQDGDGDCDSDEKPAHKVCVDEFWLGKYEVTQAQWQKIMGNNPAYFQDSPAHPVETVSWDDVQEYLKKLNWQAGIFAYRLPTEAEWEYACRAGTQTAYSFGNDAGSLGEYAWYDENSGNKTHAAGQLKPNPWGLYDMYGNVWERCQDWYDANYYSNSPEKNPQGPSSSEYRLLRGGSWSFVAANVRCAFRGRLFPDIRDADLGVRVVVVGACALRGQSRWMGIHRVYRRRVQTCSGDGGDFIRKSTRGRWFGRRLRRTIAYPNLLLLRGCVSYSRNNQIWGIMLIYARNKQVLWDCHFHQL